MSYRIYAEPDDGLKPLTSLIKKSRKFLYINSYLLDDPEILKCVEEAVKKKIDVRLMVDGRPYGINGDDGTHDEINDLKKTGAMVKIAPNRFEKPNVFDHAKYMVSERQAEVGTPNFTEAAFSKNREYFTITTNKNVIKSLKTIFLSDFNNKAAGDIPRKYLIVSPGSEKVLSDFIFQERKLLIETEEMGDDKEILKVLMDKGKNVKLIVPSTVSSTDIASLKQLKKHGVKVKYMPAEKLYMHAKMIAGKKAFIGSENFTKSSLNRNRETGIILTGFYRVSALKNKFSHDWRKAKRSLKLAKSVPVTRNKKYAKKTAK
ncbi:phospholipase D-like domain-containing protein [Ferroplasma sp.]|uniref:phospholipase D-like domain-containing protein n=1 Tax=Ferroplasma sp. TaxID=2591003 RepID=UPI00307F933E